MRYRSSAKQLLIVWAVLLWLPLSACGFVYRADAIEGWVVDGETGKPLEGVVVVAHWQLKGGFEGGTPIRELQILETATDASGRYHFPAWGPKFALSGSLKSESPEVLMFKSGYRFLGLANQWYQGRDGTKFDYHQKTVKLERFKGSLAEYAESLSSLSSSLEQIGYGVGHQSGDYCGWESFPRMLRALDGLETELRAAGVRPDTVVSFLMANESRVRERGCMSVSGVLGKTAK